MPSGGGDGNRGKGITLPEAEGESVLPWWAFVVVAGSKKNQVDESVLEAL
jgi:hypothetical protein